jgi:hypothetical protein
VELANSYIGGRGYCQIPMCVDRVACWRRFDKQVAEKLAATGEAVR